MQTKVESIVLNDRHCEKRIQDDGDVRITEIHEATLKRPLQRIIEKKRSVVYERVVEVLDEQGDVVDRIVEHIMPEKDQVQAQTMAQSEIVSKQEMSQAILSLAKVLKEELYKVKDVKSEKPWEQVNWINGLWAIAIIQAIVLAGQIVMM